MRDTDEGELDAPTSGPSNQPVGAQAGAASDSEDETAPDFGQLTALARRVNAQHGNHGAAATTDNKNQAGNSTSTPFIPKRGEKDFEPTGFAGQNRALENSQAAMFEVISSQRIISSKSIAIATWVPELQRAVVQLARGQTFASMGLSRRVNMLEDGQFEDLAKHEAGTSALPAPIAGTTKDGVFWPKQQSRLELLPEEALYLIERGSMECRIQASRDGKRSAIRIDLRDYDDIDGEKNSLNDDKTWLSMSVEQAFSTMLNADGLTRPRYQLYAYLRRLGYIVQRKGISDSLRAQASVKANDKQRDDEGHTQDVQAQAYRFSTTSVEMLRHAFYPLQRLYLSSLRLLSNFNTSLCQITGWLQGLAAKLSGISKSKHPLSARRPGLLGIGATMWDNYDAVYDRLRIVPTGYDVATSLKPHQDPAPEIFFYAWRPATHFKKSDPPLPEYQIAVVDARSTSLPSAMAFAELFASIPMPLSSQDFAQLDEEQQSAWKIAEEQRKRNDESYGRGAVRKQKELAEAAKKKQGSADKLNGVVSKDGVQQGGMLGSARHFLRGIINLNAAKQGKRVHQPHGRGSGVNVYVPLKAGRRNVIVAVNDCGTTSLLRFGEAEFARWRIAGTQREGH